MSGFTAWKRTGTAGQEAVLNGLRDLSVFRYSIERTSDLDKYFYIDITSGALMTVRTLDREEMSWHNITVLAMEMSTSPQSSQLHLNMTQTLKQHSIARFFLKHHLGWTNLVLRP